MIDFHCHLDLYPNPAQVVASCQKHKLYVLSVTTTPSAWNGSAALVEGKNRFQTAIGLHPQLAHERSKEIKIFESLLPKVKYVGEIGLDGSDPFRQHWKIQIEIFEKILNACKQEGGRVMSIHSRSASSAVLDRLEIFKGAGLPVLHWFTGNENELERAKLLNCWFSVGPAMIASNRGQALISKIPRNRILTESDGPFVKVNGKTVMPWDVEKTILGLSKLWSLSLEETKHTLRENLKLLSLTANSFNIKQ